MLSNRYRGSRLSLTVRFPFSCSLLSLVKIDFSFLMNINVLQVLVEHSPLHSFMSYFFFFKELANPLLLLLAVVIRNWGNDTEQQDHTDLGLGNDFGQPASLSSSALQHEMEIAMPTSQVCHRDKIS